jgi:FtsZ family, C-terminal domain
MLRAAVVPSDNLRYAHSQAWHLVLTLRIHALRVALRLHVLLLLCCAVLCVCEQEINAAAEVIYENVDPAANIIFGALVDERMQGEMSITVLATGFQTEEEVSELVQLAELIN